MDDFRIKAPYTQPSADIKPVAASMPQVAAEKSFYEVIKELAAQELTATGIQVEQIFDEPLKAILAAKKEVKIDVPHLIQGDNECGPTSLAMIMKYYGLDPGNYHKMFNSDTVGHGPLALKEKAQSRGLMVRQENNSSLEDLAALIDKGLPPMVLGIYGGGVNSSLKNYVQNATKAHWMVVTGYERDENGAISQIYFNNPNKSETQRWSAHNFLTKFWDNNIIPGGHRYYLAMAKKGSFQENLLKKVLPEDKISISFDSYLHAVDQLENDFYAAEKSANNLKDKIASWFT